jgi:hypothetical protein
MTVAFVGPFSRFFAKRGADPARLRAGVEAWRDDLRGSVAAKVAEQLQWDEGSDVAVEVDLADGGWLAVRLFAFYAERSELELPDDTPPLLEFDPHWREAADRKFEKSHFGQLLACSVWLPGDFPVTVRAPLPNGDTAEFGSIDLLAEQLKRLNQRTFAADLDELASWRDLPAPAGGPLLDGARRGLAALSAAAATAQRFGLPIAVRV